MARTTLLSTVAKRETAVRLIEATAIRNGATVERANDSDGIKLYVRRGPFYCMINLSRNGNHIFGHWNSQSPAKYSDAFALAIGGTVNKYHYGKATMYGTTVAEFVTLLDSGLDWLSSAEAA